jgi:glucosamine-6-phosphate deaminase
MSSESSAGSWLAYHTPVIRAFATSAQLGEAAALDASARIRAAIESRGSARIVAATGASQFEFLAQLVREPSIDWQRVEMFHLDEYIGLPIDHPASFRKYLLERLIVPAGIRNFHLLDAEHDAEATCRDVGRLIRQTPVDVAFVGIGENGHLAFNDPPADFETEAPYLVVTLDDRCRRQQVGEGWFARIEDVPATAISMSVRQILAARAIVCVVPDRRKADAVRASVEGPVDPMVPASILRTHPDLTLYLDRESASLLEGQRG